MIVFRVAALPIAQPRQRHRVVTAQGRTYAHNYTPTKHPVNAFKAAVQLACTAAYQGPPLEGPLRVTLTFVLPRPKAMCWKKRSTPRAWHTSKPDCDNLMKSLDCLTGLLWRDDTQLCDVRIRKVIAAGDEQPHADIEVETLNHHPN